MAFQHLHITCHLLAFSSLWGDLSRQHRCDWCCCACLHHWLKTVVWFCHVFQHDMCSFWFCCCFWWAKAHSTSNNHHEHPGEWRREGILHKFHQMFMCSHAFHLTHPKVRLCIHTERFTQCRWTGWQDLESMHTPDKPQHISNLLPRWAQSTRVLTNDPYNSITKVLNYLEVCNMSQIQNHFCGKIHSFVTIVNWAVKSNHQKYSNSMMEWISQQLDSRGLYAKSSYPGRSCHLFWVLGNVTAVLLWSGGCHQCHL